MAKSYSGRLTAAVSACFLVGGCTMGAMFGGNDDASYANVSPSQTQIAQAASDARPAIAENCPPAQIRPGAGFHRVMEAGGLRHQALLDGVSRDCITSNGQIVLNMSANGHVIVGPAGYNGRITLPLRFTVQRDGLLVYSERYDVEIDVTREGRNVFSHDVENVAIPYVGGETITIWVGFDN